MLKPDKILRAHYIRYQLRGSAGRLRFFRCHTSQLKTAYMIFSIR
jgi:hypothetical protein